MIQWYVSSLLGQILYKLAFFHKTHKKEERMEHHCNVTEDMWCHLTATVGRWFPPFLSMTYWLTNSIKTNLCETFWSPLAPFWNIFVAKKWLSKGPGKHGNISKEFLINNVTNPIMVSVWYNFSTAQDAKNQPNLLSCQKLRPFFHLAGNFKSVRWEWWKGGKWKADLRTLIPAMYQNST